MPKGIKLLKKLEKASLRSASAHNCSFVRDSIRSVIDLIPIVITILIFVPITNQPAYNRLVENQPPAGLHCLNEYGNEDEKWEWFQDRILTLFHHQT